MFLRQCFRNKDGKRHAYWALVESYRTDAGPRQRVVAWLGKLDEAGRLGIQHVVCGTSSIHAKESTTSSDEQLSLFNKKDDGEPIQPQWVEVDASSVRVENCRQFGGPWLALEVVRRLQLDEFLKGVIPPGREHVSWWRSALILVVARLCRPSSELYIAEQWYPKSAMPQLLGVPADRVDDNRLYRTLDHLLPHKVKLEAHLKNRMGDLFDLEYDLLMYDITSTYFEGQANFEMAQRGYSRDQRGDCKQVCIGLVVSRCGMPLGYEVFSGNTADVTTVEHIVTTMEKRYGKSDRIWVMDRGMVSEDNIDFLRKEGRRYIVGTPKSMLKEFEAELLKDDWNSIRDGLEVKLCSRPRNDDEVAVADKDSVEEDKETFILCRSRDRSHTEEAIVQRFEQKIEERLVSMTDRCEKQKRDPMKVEREIGRLLGKNTRAAKLFEVTVKKTKDGSARIQWKKIEAARDWATLSAGCYLLRSNVTDWSEKEMWKAYIQLTEAEAAFCIHKSDLKIRPIWHQKEDRVLAHIFVCFLAYVLWKTLGQMCDRAGLGSEPRRVLDELGELRMMDVILPTRTGIEIRTRCLSKPTDHQQILLDRLKLRLPKINQTEM
ncbi:MAG: IS1634 family transposase [Pirellulaceae bacterium]|jgi:transposase|nr:IS1634 family transposase [Pirellulaceae bacterium]|tara:strand:- start:72 stop:1883 length:1812 start_codon:yes stop_codon:yes gene_type:complete